MSLIYSEKLVNLFVVDILVYSLLIIIVAELIPVERLGVDVKIGTLVLNKKTPSSEGKCSC